MKLTREEIYQPVWIKVKEHTEARIEVLRKQLEAPNKDHRESDFIRGQIKECKVLLALGNLDPAKVTDSAE